MAKLDGTFNDLSWSVYAGHRYSENASLGGRLTYQVDDFRLGVSVLRESFEFKTRQDF